MRNNLLKTFGIFFLLSIIFISCKKDKPAGKTDVLTGAWQEASVNGSIGRRLIFKPDGLFTMEIWSSTAKTSEVNGTYKIDGENLTVNISESVEFNAAGNPTKRNVSYQLFEKGKFSITNTILSIKYISYPADAPVNTELKFGKIIAID
ncbi:MULTISPECIES: hypothetical protein [unclassified Pedobacter]|uniref:hypothetical protein n=1 Tax=unclassified Pedobacter TaxID=2628915 RepID=UPI001E5ABDB9|nr:MULTISPECIES: hypothetical protein [unclassified Pedobacter]